MTYCNLILEIFQLFSWRCYFLLNSVSSTPSSEPTLSNMWLLQARRRSDLPSAAPQICNISPLHFSASDPQSRRCFHVELLKKDLRRISLHYLMKPVCFFLFLCGDTDVVCSASSFEKIGWNHFVSLSDLRPYLTKNKQKHT